MAIKSNQPNLFHRTLDLLDNKEVLKTDNAQDHRIPTSNLDHRVETVLRSSHRKDLNLRCI